MTREPSLTLGAVTALVTAILALLVSLGLPISEDVQTAILGVVAAAAPFVAAVLIRTKVWSPSSHERDKQVAVDQARYPVEG